MAVTARNGLIVVGRVVGLFGVRGWVKIRSYTQPPENILNYHPWTVVMQGQRREVPVTASRVHGHGIVVQLQGGTDRDAVRDLIGADIAVHRRQLPPPEEGRYYWADLVGLEVLDAAGRSLGRVDHLMATGANDVLVVRGERERLIPFIRGRIIKDIDLERGTLTAEWDADF